MNIFHFAGNGVKHQSHIGGVILPAYINKILTIACLESILREREMNEGNVSESKQVLSMRNEIKKALWAPPGKKRIIIKNLIRHGVTLGEIRDEMYSRFYIPEKNRNMMITIARNYFRIYDEVQRRGF